MLKILWAGACVSVLSVSGCMSASESGANSHSSSQAQDNYPQAQDHFQAQDYVTDGVFTAGIEGPAVGPDGHLYVVNFAREGTIGRIEQNANGSGNAELFLALPEGSTGNGIRFDKAGTMYIADYTGHNILQVDMSTRAVSVFAHNSAMNQPNDIAITAAGVLYASDPKWADSTGQLWRIDRDGSTHLLEANMGTTNGVAVSPDQKFLYVNESIQRKVWVYDLQPSGDIANKRLLIEFADHGMDGMRCDAQGNLYIARYGAGVVAVVSSAGELLREISLQGQRPTNVAFGGADGKQVFVTLQDRGAIETFFIE
jgi:sugar lactone lactonase YvrE